ncbi:MAG TPA: hypothetical protein VGO53_14840 [Steroidobacteraceae bacterium]|jgi:hypothetical protein|nr:hypothetical protein [Steroidobacteraceae bacterium]
MSQQLYPPAGPQSIGQVLDSAFRIFEVTLVRSMLYGGVSMIAGQLQNIYSIVAGKPLLSFGGGDPVWWALYVIGAIIVLLMVSALVLRQHGIASGNRLSTSVELSEAIRRLPAYLGLSVLAILMVLVAPFIAFALFRLAGVTPNNYAVLGFIGVVAAIPVVYLMTPFTLATPALLLGPKRPFAAIRYSMRLVRDNWWRTTTIFTVGFVVMLVFYGVAMVIVGLVLPLAGATDIAVVTAATAVVSVALGAIGMPFFSALMLATFGELQVRKEGTDLEKRVAAAVQA